MSSSSSAPLPHVRAFELLPWLVNGSLAGAERAAVEEHARTCIACRRELREQQRLHAAVSARRTADISAEAGFVRLDAQLNETPNARPVSRRDHFAAAPFAVAAAAGLAVLALLVWFTPLPELGRDNYSTLATPPSSNDALLDIVFVEQTTAAEMQSLLDEIGGEIIAGPSELGRYNVRVAENRSDDELGELLGVLAADPRVRFAGRSLNELPQ